IRAAAAALPEPRSATTSTGTSFCDSSRITASTVRMPALTLSSQTRAPPFCGTPVAARISVLSRSILHFAISWPKTAGRSPGRRLTFNLVHTRCQFGEPWMRVHRTVYVYVSMSCEYKPVSPADSYVTTLRTNGKLIAHILRNLIGHYSPTILGLNPHHPRIVGETASSAISKRTDGRLWLAGMGNSFPFSRWLAEFPGPGDSESDF